jgi:hypothetical protein
VGDYRFLDDDEVEQLRDAMGDALLPTDDAPAELLDDDDGLDDATT